MGKKLVELLDEYIWKELEKEGITKEDVSLVNLDIAFSPVTPYANFEPCEVTETMGGYNYIVHLPNGALTVSREELAVMRFRYLQNDPKNIRHRETVRSMLNA